jgi:phage protein D
METGGDFMTEPRWAAIELIYQGVDISGDVAPFLLSLQYTDNGTGRADDLQITLQDRDGLWRAGWMPQNGDSIQAAIIPVNWDMERLDCGTFEVDTIEYNGPTDTIQIKGVSFPVTSGLKSEAKSKAWEKVTLSLITARIAEAAGLSAQFETDDVSYERIDQTEQTDISFLAQLAEREGATVKVTNDLLVVYDDRRFESESPVMTIERGKSLVKTFGFTRGVIDAAYASCTLTYYDSSNNQTISGTYEIPGAVGPALKIQQRVESVAEAIRYARNELRKRNREAQKARFRLIGDTSIVQGVTIEVYGYGNFDGVYFVETATHTVGGGGFETAIEARKVLTY